MNRSTLKRHKPMARGTSMLKRSPIKRKSRPLSKIRASARNEECTIRLPMVCNFDPSTTVLCHSNLLEDGKGMGLKAPDTAAAYGCSACHDTIDGRRPRPEGLSYELMIALFKEAIAQTNRILKRKGLM